MPFGAGGPVTDYKMDVGPGWASLLDQLDEELKTVAPDYQTIQVKEKFGQLRVYVDGNPIQADIIGLGNIKIEDSTTVSNWRVIQDVLDKYERKSSEVCENCGNPGEIDRSHFWIKTLCPECRAKRDRERRQAWGPKE